MKIAERSTDCYVASFKRPLHEAYLEVNGFSRGMILFAIPSYGVLFKCRAEGSLLDLEFGAFFALLRFINTSLAKETIRSIRVHSSNPEFVFSLAHNGRQVREHPKRLKMVEKYRSLFRIEVAYVTPLKNKTRVTPGDFPSTPKDITPPIKPERAEQSRIRFQPIQKGVSL